MTHRGNFIRYRVSSMTSGFVEWENLNLTPFNPQPDLFTIMGMWDPSRGDYRENPFRVHIRKLDTQGHNSPYVRMRFISEGDQHDVGWDFLEWNPSHAYRWRVEWGPSGGGNQARVFLDDKANHADQLRTPVSTESALDRDGDRRAGRDHRRHRVP